MGGNDLAVSHDIHDETMDILDAINERHGEAGVWRFMHMVEQTKREMDRGGVIYGGANHHMVNRPQIAGPKKSRGWWIFALTVVVVAAMVFV